MATRTLSVQITGDSRSLDRALKSASGSTSKFGGALDEIKRAGPAALGLVGVAAVALGKKFVDAASDIDESLTKNQVLFGKHAAGVDKWSKSTANSLGISRRESLAAAGSFGSLFETIGLADRPAAQMSQRFVRLAADLASFNNASPADTLEALRSGLSGEAEPMRKFGALLSENRVKQEAWRSGIAKTGQELTEQQKVQARYQLILKDTASAQGDFSRTSGGLANSQRRLRAQLDDIGASIGAKLLPVVRDAANWFNRFLKQMQEGRGAGGQFRRAIEDLADAFRRAWPAIRETLKDIREAVKITGGAVVGFVRTTKRVLDGDFRGAWESARITVRDKLRGDGNSILRLIVTAQNPFAGASRGLGRAIVRGITSGLSSLGEAIKKKIVSEAKKGLEGAIPLLTNPIGALGNKLLDGVGDGVGKAAGDGLGFMGGSAGASGAGLRGADFDLAPFARIGASAGLSVTSGIRPGSVTSTGNQSYHATGDAIDMGGSMSGMRRAATAIRNLFGSRIRELISPFPELGIKDGRPFRYSAGIQAQHSGSNAHVHVAYTGPFGDGIGDIRNLWTRAGGSAGRANLAAAVAMAESSGDPRAFNRNSDGSVDRGLWQINSVHGALSTFDRLGNARAAVRISGGGRDWSPWVAFKSGAYRRFLDPDRNPDVGPTGDLHSSGGASAQSRFRAARQRARGRSGAAEERAQSRRRFTPTGPQSSFGFGGGGGFTTGEPVPWWEQPLPDESEANRLAAERNRLLEQQIEIGREVSAKNDRLLALAGQGDQITKAFVALMNEAMGTSIGLGLQTPSYPGGVASY